MAGLTDPLIPLDVVRVGAITVVPDATRPVAAIIAADSSVSWAVWPDAPMPDRAIGEARLWPALTGAWLIYTAEDDDGTEMLQQRSAVFVTAQGVGAACDLGVGQPMGADAGGLWVGDSRPASVWLESADTASKDGDDDLIGVAPRAPLPTPATELERIHADGSRSVIVVDHLVHWVDLTGTRLTVQYYPTGPREELDRQYGSSTFVYEAREVEVEVDVSEGLPTSINTDQLPSRLVPEDEDEDAWDAELERQQTAVAEWTDRLELNGVEGAEWPLAALTEEACRSAIARTRARFEGLDDPSIVWTHDHPGPRRTPSDYRNVEITEEGDWPETAIVVSFEHRQVPDLRLRRRYRVFDDAGRPREWAYATVHLDEDLYTGVMPPRAAAIDGFLEI